jgi:hypothetical protein
MNRQKFTTWSLMTKRQFPKGQLISKGLFGILNSSKKWTKKFDLTTMIPQVDLFSSVFWKNLKTPKRHFDINWPLKEVRNCEYFFCNLPKLLMSVCWFLDAIFALLVLVLLKPWQNKKGQTIDSLHRFWISFFEP